MYEALLALARTGATVAVIAGNHDNARGLRAVAPLLALGNVHLVAEPRRPDDGGVWSITTRDGTPVRIAMLPFVSKRGIVRAADLMDAEAFENAQRYSDRLRLLIDALCGAFTDDAVNVLMAHTFVLGAVQGGGERPAHLVDEYAVTAASFPPSIGYGALGHLHRAQRIPAGAALHYCGSPLQLDFGEGEHPQQVNIVTAAPGVPADVRAARLTAGRRLRTVRGSIDELAALDIADDPWLRVVVRGERQAGPGRRRAPAARAAGRRRAGRRARRPLGAPPAATTTAAARRSCSTSSCARRASPTTGSTRCSPSCSTRRCREAGAPRAGGLRRLPGPDDRRLHATSSWWRSSAARAPASRRSSTP